MACGPTNKPRAAYYPSRSLPRQFEPPLFSIKEPSFRSLRDDSYYIRIEFPADLVRLYPSSPLLRDISFQPTIRHPLDAESVDELKAAGNKAFKAARWAAARAAYEWALDSLLSSTEPSPSSLAPTLYSNLALTLVRLGLPASALQAVDAGLALLGNSSSDPLRLKLLYRSALALYALERFTEALSRLDGIFEADPASSDALALQTRCRARLVEQQSGPSASTLRSLFLSTRQTLAYTDPLTRPDIADYINTSALSIRPIANRGNGLIALRPIERGELLLCLKPLAWAGRARPAAMKEEEGKLRYTAGLNLWTEQQDPWGVVECVSQVVWRLGLEGKAGREWEEVGQLWAGDELARAGADADDLPSRVEGIVTFNGFHLEDISSSSSHDEPEADLFHAPTALYPRYPSALNHSCVPNVSYTFLSTLFLLHARTEIKEGEELVDSYVDAAEDLEGRARKMRGHGFVCVCELCEEERSAGAEVRRRRQDLVEQAKEIGEDDLASGGVRERLSALVSRLEATYSSTLPPPIRPALYIPLRLLSQSFALSSPSTGSLDSIRTELRALASLGTRFKGDEGYERTTAPPLMRDMDGVLSALWIAREWKKLGSEDKSRHWVALARDMEAGQAGAEVFDLRYGEWAARHGLDLSTQGS
ncbi:hypothetical protein JCM10295v2_006928 [Rhodotorula toruloides]